MKLFWALAFSALSMNIYSQGKYDYIRFNKLTEVTGTEFVIASVENAGKILESKNKYLLFINTATGTENKVDFPDNAYIRNLEQIRIDSLGINVILVSANTVDLDGKNGIDWSDPIQIIIFSPDGKQKNQLTDDRFFVVGWKVNMQTGSIVVTGYFDTNGNNKYDKTDKSEIHIYDLKSLELKSKI